LAAAATGLVAVTEGKAVPADGTVATNGAVSVEWAGVAGKSFADCAG
jgi:high-affinity K+ transport system ATPase subunit B